MSVPKIWRGEEEWRPVVSNPRYEVSSRGRVRRAYNQRLMRLFNKAKAVNLTHNGIQVYCRVDNLVAEAFPELGIQPRKRQWMNTLDAPLPTLAFPAGLPRDTVCCPRCGGLLGEEPALLHCVMCGRLFPIVKGRLDLQTEHERASALAARANEARAR